MSIRKQAQAAAYPYGLVAVLVACAMAGCAGGGRYAVDETYIARSYLPHAAAVPSHPDSLGTVEIREKEYQVDFDLDRSFERLMRDWSATWISHGSGRSFNGRLPYRSFATLWSLDLSIASLAVEEGVEGLTKDLALDRIAQRKKEHRQFLQIDLYRFAGSPPTGGVGGTLVGRPGSFIRLEDDQGREYRPERVDNSPLREATVAGESTLYRRNTFVFRRQVDGRDLLDGVEWLRLYISQSSGERYYFTWSWEDIHDEDPSP